MKTPPTSTEAERLEFLRRLDVLDSAPDSVLDGLTRCAAQLCACPISMLSLVDEDRQWFKSRVGLAVSETPREQAFCAHAIHGPELLEVHDALADERFSTNPLVLAGPKIRFYAGVPIGDQGYRLGTLCVIDSVPRVLTAQEKESLTDLARLASAWFAARREHVELEQERQHAVVNLERLQGVAQQVPGLIFEYRQYGDGLDGFSYVSDRARDLLEMEPVQLLTAAQVFRERMHPADRSRLMASLMRAVRRGLPWTHEFRVQLPGGGVQWRSLQIAPSPPALDGAVLWRGLLTDVSQRRARETELADVRDRWSLAVEAAQLGLITLLPTEGQVLLDTRALLQHGLPAHSAAIDLDVWLGMFEFDGAEREALRAQIRSMLPGQTLTLACKLPATGDGASRRLEVVAQAQHQPSEPGDEVALRIIGTCRDVTTQVEGEQVRRELLAAEQTSREKGLFLSRVSHELRTPLNAILGFTQLLQNDAIEPLSPRQLTQVRHAHDAGKLLLNLINDVLELSAVQDARKLNLGPVDVKQVLTTCEPIVSQMAHEAAVSIDVVADDALPLAWADPLALKQVLLNLMTNAVKYNRKGGRMRVSIEALPDSIQVIVADDGSGLSESQLARLFQPFDRLGAEFSRTEGTGLGLLITRELVEAMQGRVHVTSVPGHGSTFKVELPLCSPGFASPVEVEEGSTSDAAQPQGQGPAATEKTLAAPAVVASRRASVRVPAVALLYIEDEPVNALLVQEALRAHPHLKLTVAPDGPTGLELARQLRPAVVLSDIHLPGLSGLQVVRSLRGDDWTPRPICIALSADAMQEQIDAAYEAGFDDYWTKPLDLSTVPERIERWLRASRRALTALEELH